ncbi:hypothetical protein K0N88_001208 [Salmonella enterica]|nr:hypothetical protein [Salmonella enterica]
MKYKELFKRLYYVDPTSPTGLRNSWNKEPAGYKQKTRHGNGHVWVIKETFQFEDGSKEQVMYTLANCLYELATGHEVKKNEMIFYKDVNKDNLNPVNMCVGKIDLYKLKEYKRVAFENFRNVILPKSNPDYFKDPKDWTDPEALAALETEKRKRASGEVAKPATTHGRPRRWL